MFLHKELVENTKYNNLSFYLNLCKYLCIVSHTFCVPYYTYHCWVETINRLAATDYTCPRSGD